MTIDQFLVRLANTRAHGFVYYLGGDMIKAYRHHQYGDGNYDFFYTVTQAVAEMALGQLFSPERAGQALCLEFQDIAEIEKAYRKDPGHNPELRAKLLEATALLFAER